MLEQCALAAAVRHHAALFTPVTSASAVFMCSCVCLDVCACVHVCVSTAVVNEPLPAMFTSPPPLSLRGLPNMLGPLLSSARGSADSLRVFVAVFAGTHTKAIVSSNIQLILSSHAASDTVDVLLCLYDNSDWSDLAWTSQSNVVTVRAIKQMKWWVFRRQGCFLLVLS
jgi:hypothetical protein